MIADNAYSLLQANDDQHSGCTCIFTPVSRVAPTAITRIGDPGAPSVHWEHGCPVHRESDYRSVLR